MITELDTCTCTHYIYITYHDHRTRSRWTEPASCRLANKQAQASIRNDNVTAYTCDARSRICLKTFSMFCACVIGRGLPPENRQPTIHQIACAAASQRRPHFGHIECYERCNQCNRRPIWLPFLPAGRQAVRQRANERPLETAQHAHTQRVRLLAPHSSYARCDAGASRSQRRSRRRRRRRRPEVNKEHARAHVHVRATPFPGRRSRRCSAHTIDRERRLRLRSIRFRSSASERAACV